MAKAIQVEAHEPTGYDVMVSQSVYIRIAGVYGDLQLALYNELLFADIVALVDSVTGCKWTPPPHNASADDLKAAALEFMKLPAKVYKVFEAAIGDANRALNDPDLLPPEKLDADAADPK